MEYTFSQLTDYHINQGKTGFYYLTRSLTYYYPKLSPLENIPDFHINLSIYYNALSFNVSITLALWNIQLITRRLHKLYKYSFTYLMEKQP